METRIIAACDFEKEAIAAVNVIKNGEAIIFPTETVYGIGVDGFNETACRKLYELKRRPLDKPVTEHIADMAGFYAVAGEINDMTKKLAAAFMPGPITLIVKKSCRVPTVITGGSDTVGVRMPHNLTAQMLIKAAGVPLAASSANIAGKEPPATAEKSLSYYAGSVPFVIDGGKTLYEQSSTVVDCTGIEPKIIRNGAITESMILAVLAGTTERSDGNER